MKRTIPTEQFINPTTQKQTFIASQAENHRVQLNGTAAERHARSKTDPPLINFRSRERHQLSQARGAKEGKRGQRKEKRYKNTNRPTVCDLRA